MPNLANLPVADVQAGAALWSKGVKNYLINGDFAINQRAFAGGALAAGIYGFDRWKAGTGGCSVSLTSGVLTHTSGPLVQVIEAPNLAGQTITVSVEGLSGGNLSVNVEGVIGAITAGAGRTGVTLAVPAASTGNVTVTLTPASVAVNYKRCQVELGGAATAFEWRPTVIEMSLCQRYYWKTFDQSVAPVQNSGTYKGALAYVASFSGAGFVGTRTPYPAKMRITPTITFFNPAAANAAWRNRATNTDSGAGQLSYSEAGDSSVIVVNSQTASDVLGNSIFIHATFDAEL